MGIELVLRGPVAADQQDAQFIQARMQRTAKADIFADALHLVSQIGAAQQCLERASHATARAGQDRLGSLALLRGHLFQGLGRKAFAGHGFVSCFE